MSILLKYRWIDLKSLGVFQTTEEEREKETQTADKKMESLYCSIYSKTGKRLSNFRDIHLQIYSQYYFTYFTFFSSLNTIFAFNFVSKVVPLFKQTLFGKNLVHFRTFCFLLYQNLCCNVQKLEKCNIFVHGETEKNSRSIM